MDSGSTGEKVRAKGLTRFVGEWEKGWIILEKRAKEKDAGFGAI